MESPQMYDNNQNNLPMAANTKQTTNGNSAAANNNNNTITINANLKNDHVNNGHTTTLLQKQIQQHPQQLLQQQQQIQQVVQQYTQNDLEELTNPEISLDLANFIDDQFRNEQEQFAFFNKIVPAAINAGVNGVNGNGNIGSEAAKALQQARFQQRQNPQNPLQYIPGCVTGNWPSCVSDLRGTQRQLWVTREEEKHSLSLFFVGFFACSWAEEGLCVLSLHKPTRVNKRFFHSHSHMRYAGV